MEKAKKRKYSVRIGLILTLVWLLVASLVMSVSAATNGTGNTTNSEFTWSWGTDNTNTNAAGTFEGKVEDISEKEKKLTLNISATSSTFQSGSCGGSDTNAASTTNTATVINNTGSTILIKSITKTTATCSVSEGATLANGDTFTVSITANPNSTTDGTARSSNGSVVITYEFIANVSVVYYGADGASYTYGDELLDNASATAAADVAVGSSITLPAAPTVTSGTFAGWRMSHDGSLHNAGETVTINNDTSVYPVITTEGLAKPFTVNGTPYEFWTDAAKAAGNSGTIILNQDYTLPTTTAANGVSPAGSQYVTGTDGNINYIVPAGVTLLIPFNDSYDVYTDTTAYAGEIMETPMAYLTLTLAEGTKITVNGSMNVAGKFAYTNAGGQSGSPSGPLGFVEMKSGSNITVNGKLYAYGYIIGDGTVTINRGATVYEVLQLPEYRGGEQSTEMENNVFPLSQFYVQNIEVPMTLYKGATEEALASVYVHGGGLVKKYFPSGIRLFGSGGMFELMTDGQYVTKWYDGFTDRLHIKINGDVTMNSVSLTIDAGFGTTSINSKDFVLPISGAFTINIDSGSLTIPSTQDVLLQPGAQLIIDSDATCTVNGKLYVYDAAQWGAYCTWGHSGADDRQCWDAPVIPVSYSPTRTKTRWVAIPRSSLTDSAGNAIYITDDPAIYEAVFDLPAANSGDYIAPADLSEFLTNYLPDASILVNGSLTGNVYTTADGANIYSTGSGTFTQNATANSSVYQFMMAGDYDGNSGYPEESCPPATLKNEVYDENTLPLYTATAGSGTSTYNYSAEHGRWDAAENGESHRISTTETKAASCTAAGYTTYTCSCGYSYKADFTAPSHYEGCGHAVAETLIDIYGTSVRAGDSLGMYFYVEADALVAAGGATDTSGKYYANVVQAKAVGDPKTESNITGYLYTTGGTSYYRFYFTGVAAKEMADWVYVSIYDNNGTMVSNIYSESVENYAVDLLATIPADTANTTEIALRTTLVDMLNYGAACQMEFKYNTACPANADINAYQQYATSSNPECEAVIQKGNYYLTHTVSTKSNLMYTLYFKDLPEGVTKAKITYTDHYGNPVTRNADVVSTGNTNEYRVDVTGLAIADRSQQITCDLLDSTNNVVSTTVGSIEAYVKEAREYNLAVGACNALMKFAKSAYEYFRLVENT